MADEAETSTASPPSGGRTATEYRDIADALRNRVDLFGKTLAGIATLGTTAVGLNKISDLFPAEDNLKWVVIACFALGGATLAAVAVAGRLMWVARPVFMRADLDRNEDLNEKERAAVRPVFADAARRFGYTSLIGLEERERSLRNAAAHASDDEERARRVGLADEVKGEIEQALARGQLVTIRRRAATATRGWLARGLYTAIIAGLILFAVATDKVISERGDVADAKACGEARTAKATPGELERSGVCDGEAAEPEETPEPPSAAEARATIAGELAKTLEACTKLAENENVTGPGRPLKPEDCKPVHEAMAAMDPSP